ncbi:tRNA (adenosine(37)-N6)-threonylcarbamoyltransferase complex ATPase subunit type 1 TsaE [Sinomicrobium soli]|uniref:tRNA (adenosine(37)-N6)-threonylcarbamoyltransferase complex ATPase subunit type 1 TsaE n=1 Tax=Sinomicrobium sp. N-1-3-6 TaxID=2219864 RepID=UPI000DCDAA04|nr:tRNA (adenosine(37)-N6)-threonylcarbamoyltransferase complex ATPase subunit type 1 TsaE [Sinomicrobium sp. N-1-3-6]RAV30142.1 tRNA (adenosine(37)-N6)-threonylcarbamoyltransferase complex ATPase subunit type 1 TsaE [Sinomicrobium sp. N-1-3-6]
MEKILYSLREIEAVASRVLGEARGKTLLFHGDMGVGKTTLIKAMALKLGVGDMTGSPTFGLVHEYRDKDGLPVYHFDFYRIEDETEALDMGVEEYLYSGDWLFIEWPEKIGGLLPEDAVDIYMEELEDGRRALSF